MSMRTGRTEKRYPLALPVGVASLEHPEIVESAITENACSIGVRILCKHAWRPSEHVLVEMPFGSSRSPARVVYCQSLRDGNFAIGLRFLGPRSGQEGNVGRVA